MDQTVTMSAERWQSLVAMLANAQGPGVSWATVNPILTELSRQLQAQPAVTMGQPLQPGDGLDVDPPQRRARQ